MVYLRMPRGTRRVWKEGKEASKSIKHHFSSQHFNVWNRFCEGKRLLVDGNSAKGLDIDCRISPGAWSTYILDRKHKNNNKKCFSFCCNNYTDDTIVKQGLREIRLHEHDDRGIPFIPLRHRLGYATSACIIYWNSRYTLIPFHLFTSIFFLLYP